MTIKSVISNITLFLFLACSLSAFAAVDYKAVDADLNTSISSKLSADPSLSGTNITVKTNKGVVSLIGNVDSDTQAVAATVIAQSTPYVKDVNTGKLTVKGSTQPIADTIITAKIRGMFLQKKLFGDKDVAAISINVETNNGVVSLSGTADNKKQIDNAIIIAKSVSGVKKVSSSVALSPSLQQ